MTLRAVPAHWFEVLIPRMDSARAAGTLARTGLVELERRAQAHDGFMFHGLEQGLGRYQALRKRYGHYWSRGALAHSASWAAPQVILAQALTRIDAWRQEADPVIHQLQALEAEQRELALWQQVLTCGARRHLDFALLAASGPVLDALVAVLPAEALPVPAEPCLWTSLRQPHGRCLLAVGPAPPLAALRQEIRSATGRVLQWPDGLTGSAAQALDEVAARLRRLEPRIAELDRELDRLYARHGLAEALGDVECLNWFQARVGALPASVQLAWVSGWTADPDGGALREALAREGARALLHFPAAPPGLEPPQLLRNPPWARPFEIFAQALGVPGRYEVDPSVALAVVVPLLFGYMFGDLGQGLALAGLGWLLRHRFALARILMPAGIMAAVFGLVFGSVFSREDLISALWVNPLHAPVTVLAVPLVFAVVLLAGGQVLNALEAAWRGALRHWWLAEAGLLVLYLGAAASLLDPSLQPVAVAGAAWVVLGRFALRPTLAGAAGAIGGLLEDGMRLLVNTVSFARVGAFALAHAGLSAAIVTLADAATNLAVQVLVMVLGNVLILALETLVVSVQTTRLILFEFFARFLRAEGRRFRPLPSPPVFLDGESHESQS